MKAYREDLKAKAQSLRKNMTREERHLWYDFLKSYPLHFRRQKPIGDYILDFYCSRAGLAVELDGGQHYESEAMAYDAARSQYLQTVGIRVLRFSNREIWENFTGVCSAIKAAAEAGQEK